MTRRIDAWQVLRQRLPDWQQPSTKTLLTTSVYISIYMQPDWFSGVATEYRSIPICHRTVHQATCREAIKVGFLDEVT